MCLSHQNFSRQVGMSASICMKERKAVNLQFATQKCKFPLQHFLLTHPQFCIKCAWIILVLEIYLDGGLAGWIQGARPSANLGHLARQRQLDPYGSFLYESLATVIQTSVSWSTCEALSVLVAASALLSDSYNCWLHVESPHPCEKPCVSMKMLQSSVCGQRWMEAVRGRALCHHGCTLCRAEFVVRGAVMTVRRGIGGIGRVSSSWGVKHGMDEDQLQKSRGILCHENREPTVVGRSAWKWVPTAERWQAYLLDLSYAKVHRMGAACGNRVNRTGI